MVTNNINETLTKLIKDIDFSGSLIVKKENSIMEAAQGFANRAEEIPNKLTTRYGIASGCKLFTAIAICQLVEKDQLTFQTKLADCLNIDFPHFDKSITVHH